MELFVQIAFDLRYPTSDQYEKVGAIFATIGLRKTYVGADNVAIQLPANTYVGEMTRYHTVEEAMSHLPLELNATANHAECYGHAFVTVCPIEHLKYFEQPLAPGGKLTL